MKSSGKRSVLRLTASLSRPVVTPQSQTSDKCKKLAQSLGFGPNYSAPSSNPVVDDPTWPIGAGISLAATSGMALRSYVGAAGSRAIGGRSVGATMGEMATGLKGLNALGVGVSAYQAGNAYANGDSPAAMLSTVDALVGVAGFFPGPDIGAAAYFATRIAGDMLTPAQPSVLERMGTLQQAGCL